MISKKNILNLESRQKIYGFIKKNPGLHQIEISRKMNIPKSTLIHHLRYLEKEELITSDDEKGLKRYYLSYKLGKQERIILKCLREKTPRLILAVLLFFRVCSQIELCDRLGKSPKTINYHLNKLVKANIIEVAPIRNGIVHRISPSKVVLRKPVGREIIYRFKSCQNTRSLYNLFIANENSLRDDILSEGFFDELREHMKVNETPYTILSY